MKRVRGLMPQITTWENFVRAAHRAAQGKRHRKATGCFLSNLSQNVSDLICSVEQGVLPRPQFTRFVVYDPKRREIHAPSFRDRVLHHAIMGVCEPYLERRLISQTFACRVGYGQSAAVQAATQFSRQFPTFLKMDVRRFFDSINHEVVESQLRAIFADRDLLSLFQQILAGYHTAPGTGLPIGSLTSQHLANAYLSPLDRYVKETLRIRGYVRYMDDFVVWGRTTRDLRQARCQIEQFLAQHLELETKYAIINATRHGFDFLGCRVFRGWAELARQSKQRFVTKYRKLGQQFAAGKWSQAEYQQSLAGLTALPLSVHSWHFRQSVLSHLMGDVSSLEPGQPGR